jgi:hypothetical protein
MTKEKLRNKQISLGYSASDMARALKTPLRTYQDWLAGVSRIPGVVEVAVEGLINKDRWTMQTIKNNIDARINHDFPNGIRCN